MLSSGSDAMGIYAFFVGNLGAFGIYIDLGGGGGSWIKLAFNCRSKFTPKYCTA